ncbi:S-adenosyl-L-methionine-dependent methyltransferase [Xylariaceae sp. FL0662B]|nr:S-adenosyl-L-methionine-dependent methyltransferase [Xylariaceae sp. FL0662B]
MASNPEPDLVTLTEQIEKIAAYAQSGNHPQDGSVRRRLGEAGLKLSLAMEAPHDTVHRIGNTPLQPALASVGIKTGLFKALAECDGSTITNDELSRKTNIDPALMRRLLRYYQSLGMVSQLGPDSFGPSNTTKNMTSPICHIGVYFYFQVLVKPFISVPQFLEKIGYTSPTDPSFSAWNIGWETDDPPWIWLQTRPELAKYVSDWMAVQREGLPSFLDAIDFDKEFGQGSDDYTPLLVDAGGGMGHQCVAFRQKYPNLPGRVILQDQPHVIEQVRSNPLPGFKESAVEAEIHDLMTPQPIKGARTYYLRNVLHDFPDDVCRKILEGIRAGMTEDSVVLIDEMVLSESNAPSRAAQMDMAMLLCLAAKERSEREWMEFLDSAGFRIVRQYTYSKEFQDAVLVAVPK